MMWLFDHVTLIILPQISRFFKIWLLWKRLRRNAFVLTTVIILIQLVLQYGCKKNGRYDSLTMI